METSVEVCTICCEPYNKSTRKKVVCPIDACSHAACKPCIRKYLISPPLILIVWNVEMHGIKTF